MWQVLSKLAFEKASPPRPINRVPNTYMCKKATVGFRTKLSMATEEKFLKALKASCNVSGPRAVGSLDSSSIFKPHSFLSGSQVYFISG